MIPEAMAKIRERDEQEGFVGYWDSQAAADRRALLAAYDESQRLLAAATTRAVEAERDAAEAREHRDTLRDAWDGEMSNALDSAEGIADLRSHGPPWATALFLRVREIVDRETADYRARTLAAEDALVAARSLERACAYLERMSRRKTHADGMAVRVIFPSKREILAEAARLGWNDPAAPVRDPVEAGSVWVHRTNGYERTVNEVRNDGRGPVCLDAAAPHEQDVFEMTEWYEQWWKRS